MMEPPKKKPRRRLSEDTVRSIRRDLKVRSELLAVMPHYTLKAIGDRHDGLDVQTVHRIEQGITYAWLGED